MDTDRSSTSIRGNSEQDEKRYQRCKRELSILGSILAVLFVTWLIVTWNQKTILLTPVDANLQCATITSGACIGALVPFAILRLLNAYRARPLPLRSGITIGIIFSLAFVGTFAGIGASAAWQLSNAIKFAHSRAPLQRYLYHVLYFGNGKGGPYVAIDPFGTGQWTTLRVSRSDYGRLQALDRPHILSPLCFPAQVQRQGAAVRMLKPQSPARSEQVLILCS